MELAFVAVFFVLITAGIAVLGYGRYVRPARFRERLGETGVESAPHIDLDADDRPMFVKVVQHIGEKAPISPGDAKLARRYLFAAGYRTDTAIRVYYGFKILLCIGGFLASLVLRAYITNPVGSIIVIPALAAGGWFLPNLIVDRLISRRQEQIRFSLPDALDLLVVCMEAGLGLDQAIAAVSRELKNAHPAICEEFALVTLEMRHGKRRMEALKNMADRAAEPDLRKLVATMVQADRFGTSLGESLRTHSEFMRTRRRQEAEERAAKVGVKLVFPIFFFILPAMMIVAAGPGVLALFKNLLPLMNNF
jgi:tight adherence protein C